MIKNPQKGEKVIFGHREFIIEEVAEPLLTIRRGREVNFVSVKDIKRVKNS